MRQDILILYLKNISDINKIQYSNKSRQQENTHNEHKEYTKYFKQNVLLSIAIMPPAEQNGG